MIKTIHVSEAFHSLIEAYKKEDETMEETLRRLIRVPHPNEVAEVLSEGQVDEVEVAIEELYERDPHLSLDVQEGSNEDIQRSELVRLLARYDREKHRKIYDDLANE